MESSTCNKFHATFGDVSGLAFNLGILSKISLYCIISSLERIFILDNTLKECSPSYCIVS